MTCAALPVKAAKSTSPSRRRQSASRASSFRCRHNRRGERPGCGGLQPARDGEKRGVLPRGEVHLVSVRPNRSGRSRRPCRGAARHLLRHRIGEAVAEIEARRVAGAFAVAGMRVDSEANPASSIGQTVTCARSKSRSTARPALVTGSAFAVQGSSPPRRWRAARSSRDRRQSIVRAETSPSVSSTGSQRWPRRR